MPHAFDVQDFVRQFPLIYPSVATGTIISSVVDLRGKRGLAIAFTTGIWTTGALTLNLQHAQAKDDGSAPGAGEYVTIPDTTIVVDRAAGGAHQLIRIAVRATSIKSHLRLALTSPTGNPGVAADAVAIDPFGDPDADTWDLVV